MSRLNEQGDKQMLPAHNYSVVFKLIIQMFLYLLFIFRRNCHTQGILLTAVFIGSPLLGNLIKDKGPLFLTRNRKESVFTGC